MSAFTHSTSFQPNCAERLILQLAAWTIFAHFGGGADDTTVLGETMSDSLEYYTRVAPSNQAMLDIFKGQWSSKMPDATGLETTPGPAGLFEDQRITWAGQVFGGFDGKRILELGPLEGGHSYMLHKAGASQVVAVEANSKAFLKCLIVKQIFDLTNVEFLFGDVALAQPALEFLYHLGRRSS